MTRPDRPRGFSLLEVLVALSVLALSMMALGDLVGNALRNHAYARDLDAATLLARAKVAELEETYEDKGFKGFDETEEGDFAGAGQPRFRWRAEVLKPSSAMGPDQLVAALLGMTGGESGSQELLSKLLGTGGQAGPAVAPAGLLGAALQSQLTAFGEALKASLRELRLTVAWKDGRRARQFTVVTHLVVLHPRAPGGARGTAPDVPPGLSAPAAQPAGSAQPGPQVPGAKPGTTPSPAGSQPWWRTGTGGGQR